MFISRELYSEKCNRSLKLKYEGKNSKRIFERLEFKATYRNVKIIKFLGENFFIFYFDYRS